MIWRSSRGRGFVQSTNWFCGRLLLLSSALFDLFAVQSVRRRFGGDEHFADQFCRENNFRSKRVTLPAVELLSGEQWRGNVRELRNTVERLMVMTPGDVIDVAEIRGVLRSALRVSGSEPARAKTLREFKEASERAFLVEKLREQDWNISKTAEVIETPRSNLYKKLDQHYISKKQDG